MLLSNVLYQLIYDAQSTAYKVGMLVYHFVSKNLILRDGQIY